MANFIHVGDIIERERLRREAQIAKGVNPDVVDHIEKAVQNDSFQSDMKSNLSRFADDISGFDKAETEFLLSKLQRQLNADSGSVLLKSMQTIALQHMNDIQKADEGRAVGETKQINGKTYVWTEYAPGKFDWHVSEKRGKQEQPQGNKQAKTPEAPNVSSHAKGASTDALKRAAADKNAAPEVRQAAKKELESRGGESNEKEQQAAQSKNAEKTANARKEKQESKKKTYADFGYKKKSDFDNDQRYIFAVARGEFAFMKTHSQLVNQLIEDCREDKATRNLYEYWKNEGIFDKKDTNKIDSELSKIDDGRGEELVSSALDVMGFSKNHSFAGKEDFGEKLVSWVNKYATKNKMTPEEMFDYISDNMSTIVDAPVLDEEEIEEISSIKGWDELNDIVNEMTESFELPPEEIEKFKDDFLAVLSADMGYLGNSRKERASQKKLVSIAYDFQKNNPDVKLMDRDWQEIVGGDVDEVKKKYGKMKGFKKLNSALERFYDGE